MSVTSIVGASEPELGPQGVVLALLGPMKMWFHVPDPTVAGGVRRPLPPTAPMARHTLAVLAMRPNGVVTVPELVEELWGMDLPRKPLQSVQTYILILRRLLDRRRPNKRLEASRILTEGGGYSLSLSRDKVDAHVYVDLVRRAGVAFSNRQYDEAWTLLDRAEQLYCGAPLAGIECGYLLERWVRSIEDGWWWTALDLRAAILMIFGRPSEAAILLNMAWSRSQYREKTAWLLMLAEYLNYNQLGALRVFRALREALIEDQGAEPSPPLATLHQGILRHVPELNDLGQLFHPHTNSGPASLRLLEG